MYVVFSESKTMQTLLVVLYIAGGVIGTIIFILILMCVAQRCFSKNSKEYYVSFKLKLKLWRTTEGTTTSVFEIWYLTCVTNGVIKLSKPRPFVLWRRMRSSRMRTVPCSGCLSCHACPPPPHHTHPCHTCPPPVMHAPFAMHTSLYHKCPPFATHAPPLCCAHPLFAMHAPPPLWTDRRLWTVKT